MQVFRLVVLFVWNYFPCGRVKGEKRFCMGGIGATYFPHLEIECPPRTCFGVMKHNEKKFSTPTIRCDLSIATRDEKMHRWIILVVNPRFLVADGSHLFNHRLVWALIFFIFKKKQSFDGRFVIYNMIWELLLKNGCQPQPLSPPR